MNCAGRVFHGGARVAQATHTSARRGRKLGSIALCRSAHQLRSEVSGVRGQAFERECGYRIEVDADTLVRLGDRALGMQVHLFILHASPEPLDEHVVDPASFAIHPNTKALGSHLTPSGTFSATLTTGAFDASHSRWFATRPCRLIARDHAVVALVVLSSPTPLAAAH
jgi:hypothetical protein